MESLEQIREEGAAAAATAHEAIVRERHRTFEKIHFHSALYRKDEDDYIGGEIKPRAFSDEELVAVIKALSTKKKTKTASVSKEIENFEAIGDMLEYVLGRCHATDGLKALALAACKSEQKQRVQ